MKNSTRFCILTLVLSMLLSFGHFSLRNGLLSAYFTIAIFAIKKCTSAMAFYRMTGYSNNKRKSRLSAAKGEVYV